MEKGYQLHRTESLADSLRRISAWQTARTTKILRDESMSLQERVHEARKRIKETRALIRLFRESLGDLFDDENRRLRNAGRELAPYRDATAVIEAIKSLPPRASEAVGRSSMRALRSVASDGQRILFADESALRARFETVVAQLAAADELLTHAPLSGKTRFSVIEDDLVQTLSDGRRAMAAAYESGDDASFHEWRKRVKDHEHHIELLMNVWPKMMTTLEKEIASLARHLGHHHDLAVVAEMVRKPDAGLGGTDEVHRIDRLLAALRKRTVTSARPIADRIYAIRPRHFAREILELWRTWHE